LEVDQAGNNGLGKGNEHEIRLCNDSERPFRSIAAIGTAPNKILSLFIMEGFLLGLLGTLVGVVISLGSIYAMNIFQISFDFGRQKGLLLSPTIGTSEVITVSVIVVAISVLASLQPAWKAAKMDPITALRHV